MAGNRDGYVYILSNESMPGLVKIGKSRRGGRHRAKEIYQTGVPTAFRLEYEVYTHDCDSLEQYAHESLCDKRVSLSREFFKIEIQEAIQMVSGLHLEDYGSQEIYLELADVGSDLATMFKNAVGKCQSITDVFDMKCALCLIDPKAVNAALTTLHERQKESSKRRNKAADPQGLK